MFSTILIQANQNNFLYYHEFGLDDGSTTPDSAIQAHIESSQLSIGDGYQYLFLSRLIPDITFDGSTSNDPTVTFTLKTRNFPGGEYLQSNGNTVVQSAKETSSVVEQFTNEIDLRLRGRSFALKISNADVENQWRLGTPRVEIRPDGRR